MFGKASAHVSEELKQGWRSLKILCIFGSMGLYVTTKGILFMSCRSLLSLSASSLEVDVVFLWHLLCILSCIPVVGGSLYIYRVGAKVEIPSLTVNPPVNGDTQCVLHQDW